MESIWLFGGWEAAFQTRQSYGCIDSLRGAKEQSFPTRSYQAEQARDSAFVSGKRGRLASGG